MILMVRLIGKKENKNQKRIKFKLKEKKLNF